MNDILLKVDFPVKPKTLYLYKGKYTVNGNEILDGVMSFVLSNAPKVISVIFLYGIQDFNTIMR